MRKTGREEERDRKKEGKKEKESKRMREGEGKQGGRERKKGFMVKAETQIRGIRFLEDSQSG